MPNDAVNEFIKVVYTPATWVYVENEKKEILVLKRPDGKYFVPGGDLKPAEIHIDAAYRYALEQAGIETEGGGSSILPSPPSPHYIVRPGINGILYEGTLFLIFGANAKADRAIKVRYVDGELCGNQKDGEPMWVSKPKFDKLDLTPGSGLLREILQNGSKGGPLNIGDILNRPDIEEYLSGFIPGFQKI